MHQSWSCVAVFLAGGVEDFDELPEESLSEELVSSLPQIVGAEGNTANALLGVLTTATAKASAAGEAVSLL